MRDIKFRGKSMSTKEWVYGDLSIFPNTCFIRCIDQFGESVSVQVDPDTVGEFIGCYADGHEELYEGDVVEMFGGETCFGTPEYYAKGVIRYNGASFDVFNCYGCPEGLLTDWAYSVKKLGNIYDNPELLKGENI